MTPRLVFDGITKRFGGRLALDCLSLSVEAGEIYGFLGPNGAGKTTAIYLAMGFLLADSGRGALLGRPFTQARAARAKVGYVEDAPVFFAGTALDAVMLAARLNGAHGRATVEYARMLLERMDLPAEGQDARRFSRGMQQRLALAQALVTRPELLILDEPASALDPQGMVLVRDALRAARDQGAAVFLSSHQLHEVEHLCDRVAFMRQGRVLRAGHMAEMLRETAYAIVTLRGVPEDSLLLAGGGVGDRTFRVPVAEQRAFLEQAWTLGAELVRLEREQQTLEELFTRECGLHEGVKT